MKIDRGSKSLVDAVEARLIQFFKEEGLKPGDSIPKELELMETLGVGRSVVREALSRFRMLGIVESRTKRGMILLRPSMYAGMDKIIELQLFSQQDLLDILGLRASLEIGIASAIIRNISDRDIIKLERIVSDSNYISEDTRPSSEEDISFHSELYRISGNRAILDFMTILAPILAFSKSVYSNMFETYDKERSDAGLASSHKDIIDALKKRSVSLYMEVMNNHFKHYTDAIDKL